jgi:hypothetical protein
MELSVEDKHANYMTLMRAIWHSTDRKDIDKWWKDEHKEFIMDMRKHFPDFNCVLILETTPEKTAELEENRRRCEVLMQNLEKSIRETDNFDLVVYRLFALNLEPIVRQHIPEDDLSALMGKMTM